MSVYKCDICSVKFPRLYGLERHKNSKSHKRKEKEFTDKVIKKQIESQVKEMKKRNKLEVKYLQSQIRDILRLNGIIPPKTDSLLEGFVSNYIIKEKKRLETYNDDLIKDATKNLTRDEKILWDHFHNYCKYPDQETFDFSINELSKKLFDDRDMTRSPAMLSPQSPSTLSPQSPSTLSSVPTTPNTNQKSTNSTNIEGNSNTTNNTANNTTNINNPININITIVHPFGSEDLSQITREDIINLIRDRIPENLVSFFNELHYGPLPENNNIAIAFVNDKLIPIILDASGKWTSTGTKNIAQNRVDKGIKIMQDGMTHLTKKEKDDLGFDFDRRVKFIENNKRLIVPLFETGFRKYLLKHLYTGDNKDIIDVKHEKSSDLEKSSSESSESSDDPARKYFTKSGDKKTCSSSDD